MCGCSPVKGLASSQSHHPRLRVKSQVSGFYLLMITKIHPLIPCSVPTAESLVKTTHIPCMDWHKLPVVFSFPHHTPSPCHSAKCSPRDLFISRDWLCHFLTKAAQRPAVALSREHLFLTHPFLSGHYAPSHVDSNCIRWLVVSRICHSVPSAGTIPTYVRPHRFFLPPIIKESSRDFKS